VKSVEQKDTENLYQAIDQDREYVIEVSRKSREILEKFYLYFSGSYCSNNENSTNIKTCIINARSYPTIEFAF
jgi:hypothetical protein